MNLTLVTFATSFLFITSSALACDQGLELFKKTIFPKVRRDCVGCHDGRKSEAPAFAVDNAQVSYEHLLNYMNFSKIDQSLLVIRSGNGHCGEEVCDVLSGLEMKEMAEQWWEQGEKLCERNGKYFTTEVPIPKELPTSQEGFKTLSFDLEMLDIKLKGISFIIDIQNYQDKAPGTPGAYRLRYPRLVGGSGSILVKDVKVLLNGKYDPIYNAYTTVENQLTFIPVDGQVDPATVVLSATPLILLKDGLENPQLSVSFVVLNKLETEAPCANLENFNTHMAPALTTLQCATCHQGNGASLGEKVFDVTKDAEEVCQISQQLMDKRFIMTSALLSFPKGRWSHPQLSSSELATFVQAFKKGLKKE